jgi:hypothetical protein
VPAEGIHLTALREAMAAPALGAAARRRIARHEDAARLGALLVDLPYFDRYLGEVVRYLAGVAARPSPWGARLHEGGAVALMRALLAVARVDPDPRIGAIALGLASHVAIDRALHPLVNALARAHPHGDHGSSHREVEKFQSICFHEAYLGRDLMGQPGIRHHLTIHLAGTLDDAAIARPLQVTRRPYASWRASAAVTGRTPGCSARRSGGGSRRRRRRRPRGPATCTAGGARSPSTSPPRSTPRWP